jgi:hypothetical protein
MIRLSYTSLNNLLNGHEWINKQMGIPVPDYPFLREGKEAHRIIQDHVSGKKKHELLSHISIEFPIVEQKDFDERCKFTIPINEKYEVIGYVDGFNPEIGNLLEIKSSSTNWSMTKFRDSIQRKIYSLAFPEYEESYLITGSKDPEEWKNDPPKLYSIHLSPEDKKEALEWITEGIKVLESGKFDGGLDSEGFCTGCFWNMPRFQDIANCHFKRI